MKPTAEFIGPHGIKSKQGENLARFSQVDLDSCQVLFEPFPNISTEVDEAEWRKKCEEKPRKVGRKEGGE